MHSIFRSDDLYRDRSDNKENENEKNAELKQFLKKGVVPMVLIVVAGGPGTLEAIEETMGDGVPILVLSVTIFK